MGEHRVKNTQQAAHYDVIWAKKALGSDGIGERSPEKLRKILEKLAALAGESTNATRHDK